MKRERDTISVFMYTGQWQIAVEVGGQRPLQWTPGRAWRAWMAPVIRAVPDEAGRMFPFESTCADRGLAVQRAWAATFACGTIIYN